MKMKRSVFTFSIFLFLLASNCFSQTISVSSFKLLDSDLTANTAGTMEKDQNGETAALIKVVTTQTGFTFDGGALGIVKTKQTPGEVWVYIPRGSKKISIKHAQLGVLRDYYFPISIEAARTYEMVLASGEIHTILKESSRSQYLVIKVKPTNAIVELNNEILPVSDGIAQKFLKFGTYEYRVQAQNYHTSAGKVTIDSSKEKKVLSIELQPAFGWIEVDNNEELAGAQVYIDNSLIGNAPIRSENLASGSHSVKIVKPLFHSFEDIVNVRDNETTTIKPSLIPDYSTVNINVGENAEIFVNEEYKGNGQWTGNLAAGTYVIEAKKDNHRSTIVHRDILSTQKEYVLNLDAPTPILGEINIISNPSISDVYIDDNFYGQTPLYIPDFFVGEHHVVIKKDRYEEYDTYIKVLENQQTKVDAMLTPLIEVSLSCNVPNPNFYLNGDNLGALKNILFLKKGKFSVKLTKENYNDYTEDIIVSEENKVFSFSMKEKEKYRVKFVYSIDDVKNYKYIGSPKIEKYKSKKKDLEREKCLLRIQNEALKSGGSVVLLSESPDDKGYIKIVAHIYN